MIDYLATLPEIYGRTPQQYLYGAALVVGAYLLTQLLIFIFKKQLAPLVQKTSSQIDDKVVSLITKPNWFCLTPVYVYLGTLPLEPTTIIFRSFAVAGATLQIGIWVTALAQSIIQNKFVKQGGAAANASGLLIFFTKFGVWSVAILFLIANFGVDITALVAGLGVGGIAVALAVQNILGDLIGSLSIVLDKPFAIGDYVIIDDLQGNVEHIGVKTTRIRSLSGEQLVFSNSDLLSSRIRNYKQLQERRINFSIGVTYQTSSEKLKQIPSIVEETIASQENVRFDRCHFSTFGDSALNFEIVYYVLLPEYREYMDRQQAINLTLFEAFESKGIEFAYPTQTLFVENS